MDAQDVTPEDAGNNFFLDGMNSVGKNRAEEAVKYLSELNDGVEGVADKSVRGFPIPFATYTGLTNAQ